MELKTCQSCTKEFSVTPEDTQFYTKLDVPAPTFCAQCRLIRRLTHMNVRALYKRTCDKCTRTFISTFSSDKSYTVYCPQCWWSDAWDPMEYGKPYDFTKPFFVQFKELLETIPQLGLNQMYTSMVNTEYASLASYLKNCYLMFNSDYSEDCAYGTYLEHSKESYDMYMSDECERCYASSNLFKCHRVTYSAMCNECVDVHFSYNSVNCSNCFGCVNLRNAKYCIFNKQYTKEEYELELKQLQAHSHAAIVEIQKRVETLMRHEPRKYASGLSNMNVTGDYIFNSRNTSLSYEIGGNEDSKYCQFLFLKPSTDCFDVTMWGENLTRSYECLGVGSQEDMIKFSHDCWAPATNLTYSLEILYPNNNLFGCYGLRNKQYTKEEYEELVPKIIEHMHAMPYVDAKGRVYTYGEFFPSELSRFHYNETLAQEYFPLTDSQAVSKGFTWQPTDNKEHKATIQTQDLPDSIREAKDSVTQEVIACAHAQTCTEQCTGAFRIIPQELAFYRAMDIPLPRLCPNCRHYGRLARRTPLTTVFREEHCGCTNATHSHAQRCTNTFLTAYPTDTPYLLYCESCYNAEIA